MVRKEKTSLSLAADIPTIVQHDDEGVCEIIPSFVTEFSDALVKILKEKEQIILSKLVNLLRRATFEIIILMRLINSVGHYKTFSTRTAKEIVKDNGLH